MHHGVGSGKAQAWDGTLLRSPLQNYYLGWERLINSDDFRVKVAVYAGMGPDLHTALLVGNPDVIIGIDDAVPELSRFDGASSDQAAWQETALDNHTMKALLHKRDWGFWNQSDLWRIDVESALILELQALGVASVEVLPGLGRPPALVFMWQHPAETTPRKRTVYWVEGEIGQGVKLDALVASFKVDLALLKSVQLMYYTLAESFLASVRPHLSDRAVMLWGEGLEGYEPSVEDTDLWLSAQLTPEFERFASPDEEPLRAALREQEGNLNIFDAYGWRLRGFRRNQRRSAAHPK